MLATIGSLIGNIALFQAARHGRRLFGKQAAAPGCSTKGETWFSRYGLLTVFVPAVTPVAPLPLKLFVVSAGAMRVSFPRFLGVIVVARLIRYLGLAWLALQLGENATGFLRRNVWTLAGLAFAAALAIVFLMRWRDRRRAAVEECAGLRQRQAA